MSAMILRVSEPDVGLPRGRPSPRRYVFLVEGPDEVDLLVRILTPFAVAGAKLVAVEFSAADNRAIARLETEGLSQERAEHLCRRLGCAPAFTRVGFGWTERCERS